MAGTTETGLNAHEPCFLAFVNAEQGAEVTQVAADHPGLYALKVVSFTRHPESMKRALLETHHLEPTRCRKK